MPKDKQVSTLPQLGRATSGTFNILSVCVYVCVCVCVCVRMCVHVHVHVHAQAYVCS